MDETPLGSPSNSVYFLRGSLLTLWEELVVGVYLNNSMHKWKKTEIEITSFDVRLNTFFVPVLFCLFFVILHPRVFDGFNFIFYLSEDNFESRPDVQGTTFILAYYAARVIRIVFPACIIAYICRKGRNVGSKKNVDNKIEYFLCFCVLAIFYALIIDGNSRNSLIIPGIAMLFSLMYLFPQRNKNTFYVCVILIGVAAVVSTLWKVSQGTGEVETLLYSNSELSYQTSYLEIYFAGISNMGKAVAAYQATHSLFNLDYIINDVFMTLPIFSKIADIHSTSAYMFELVWQRDDQVIPMTGNGIIYFGYVLGPIMPILTIKLARYFEDKVQKANNIVALILCVYSTAVVSYNIFNAFTSLCMKLFFIILPLIYINNKINNYDKRKICRKY